MSQAINLPYGNKIGLLFFKEKMTKITMAILAQNGD
jgi:hypothetical protein